MLTFFIFIATIIPLILSDNIAYIEQHVGVSCVNPEYASIQAAITASSDGQTIVVCCGTHSVSSDIDVTKKVKIVGSMECIPKPKILFTYICGNINLLSDNIWIDNLAIEKTVLSSGCAPESYYAMSSSPTCIILRKNLKITNCDFLQGFHNGIFLRYGGNVRIEDCTFHGMINSGIKINYADGNVFIYTNCFFGWHDNAIVVAAVASGPADSLAGGGRILPLAGCSVFHGFRR